MSEYLKTRYPGIFQYVGVNGTVYGIDYRLGGKKHREIIGSLLGDAQEKLAEMRRLAKRGQGVPASVGRRSHSTSWLKNTLSFERVIPLLEIQISILSGVF